MRLCEHPSLLICCLFLLMYLKVRGQEEEETVRLMKAVVMNSTGKPSVLNMVNVPIPKLSSEQVLVKVKAAGINKIDIYTRLGTTQNRPQFPFILGKEIAGIVEEVDSSVEEFATGDRVFCGIDNGGYAEYAVAKETDCHILPNEMSFSQGAALYITYLIAYSALIVKGNLSNNRTLLIHGATGSLGSAAVQIAKTVGAVVVATVKDKQLNEVMKQTEADCVAYHDFRLVRNKDKYLREALKTVNRTSFDVVVDALRNRDLQQDKKFLSVGGRIILVGKKASDKINEFLFRPKRGLLLHVSPTKFNQTDQAAAMKFITDGIKKGTIKPIIDREYSLEEASQAHFDISASKVNKGKCVFVL